MKIKCETKPLSRPCGNRASVVSGAFAGLIALAAVGLGAVQAQAAPGGKPGPAAHVRAAQVDHVRHDGWRGERRDKRKYHRPVVHGRVIYVPRRHVRHHGKVLVLRPYGHRYRGYGYHRHDHDARRWLALTAIAVRLLDYLSEHQQRAHEAAQIRATTAPVGEVIHWRDGSARGAVVTVRDGMSQQGRYCREFQQTVTVGGRTEEAYGTACRQPDGAWQVVSAGQ